MARILLYGYGNPGRRDDGLGPALAQEASSWGLPGLAVESGYQLQIEDAALVAKHDVVVFVDADRACADPFELKALAPAWEPRFTTHSIAPESILALAHEHFNCGTAGFVLGIRGHEFDDYGEGLSARARRNLAAASEALRARIRDGSLSSDAGIESLER